MFYLSQRQIEIAMEFYQQQNELIKLSSLANKFKITVRSIQNDIKALREVIESNGVEIQPIAGKGCVLIINNQTKATAFFSDLSNQYYSNQKFSNHSSRVNYIISELIKRDSFIKSIEFSERMFISQSIISSDLKEVRRILAKYDLELISKPGHGIRIMGNEMNKRFCLIKENILLPPVFDEKSVAKKEGQVYYTSVINEIVTNYLLESEFRISDIVLQNLIIHIYVSIMRMKRGLYIVFENNNENRFSQHTYDIASKIMNECCARFEIQCCEAEVLYLAINLFSKREFDDQNFISSTTNTLVIDGLERIKQLYQIDLTNELELRIALGLHILPLMVRVENDMQFKNVSILQIKQNYPLAYNVASDFTNSLFPAKVVLTEDEISYVAVHFLGTLEKKITQKSTNRILIISQYRKSDTILLKQKIFRYIENLNEIDIVPEFALKSDDFLSYDAILTTEKDIAQKYPNIRFINYFLNDSDLKKIEFALKGVNSIDDILDKFDQDMFIVDKFNNKDEIIKALYLKAKLKFNLDDRLFKSVMLHEERYSSSYFGNGIAIPHPEELITDMTFISVAKLKNEVYWDNDFNVRMVFLISIEKNNLKSLQLWNHLSLLISNERFISSIDKVESFEDFISSVKDVFKEYF